MQSSEVPVLSSISDGATGRGPRCDGHWPAATSAPSATVELPHADGMRCRDVTFSPSLYILVHSVARDVLLAQPSHLFLGMFPGSTHARKLGFVPPRESYL
jgi:hypothetical protein